jgi:microfibrillar-associated protein 1
MSAPRSNPRLAAPVKRYRAGQAPTNVQESSDEEEDEEEQEQQEAPSIQRRDHASQAIQFAQKEVITGVEKVAISDQDAASDRRLRRLKEAQEARTDESGRRRRRFEEDEPAAEAKEESEDEDEIAAQRQRMKQRALEQRKAQEAEASRLQEAMPIEEEEEDEDEEEVRRSKLLLPLP